MPEPRALRVGLRTAAALPGLACLGLALAIAPETWSAALRPGLTAAPPPLAAGATLFRLVLALLGAALLALAFLPPRPAREGPGAPAWSRAEGLGFGTLLALGTALRFIDLDAGLWYDEIRTALELVRQPFGVALSSFSSSNQHLLYTLAASASEAVWGPGAWALRLPAAVAGSASLAALHLLGRRLVGRGPSLVAMALLAVSYHGVWFSQNARGYSALLCASLLAAWLLLRALDNGRDGAWLAFAAVFALGLATHLTMLFNLPAFLLLYLRASRGRGARNATRELALGFGGGALLALLVYAFVLPAMLEALGGDLGAEPLWRTPLWALGQLAEGLRRAFGSAWLGGLVASLGLAGAWSLRKNPLVVLLGLGVTTTAAAMLLSGRTLWPRLFFFCAGYGLLALSAGLREVCARWGRPGAFGPAAALLVLVAACFLPGAYGPKQDFEGALRFVEAERSADARVFAPIPAGWVCRAMYGRDWQGLADREAFARALEDPRELWLVYCLRPSLELWRPGLPALIDAELEVVARFAGTLAGGEIVVCRRPARGQ